MRRLALGAAGALAAGALLTVTAIGSLARVAQDPNPSASYPAKPRTVTGTDPFAVLPKPQECAPSRDRPGVADYFPLAQLRQRKGDNPFALRAPATTVLTLVNKKGQQFRIYVSAGSAKTVSRYIQLASACVEAITLKKADPAVLVPVRISAHLVDAAVEKTGKSQVALSALRDTLTATGPASLADVITAAGGTVDGVLVAATEASTADLAARVTAGDLTAAEVAALDVPTLVKALAVQARAPFLTPPGDDPKTPAERGKLLIRNPTTVVVGIVPVSTSANPLPGRYVGWAAFDFSGTTTAKRSVNTATLQGPLAAGAYHNYIAKCQNSASAQIFAQVGAATLKLWRVSDWADYASSYAATGVSRKLYASWTNPRTYDTWVRGIVDNTLYSMYYNWTRGTGGGC